jgi:hypothetical protein
MNTARQSRSRRAAFSLIEVTIALGIVSFGILTIVGLMSSLGVRSSEVVERREALSALASLNAHLAAERTFDVVSGWVQATGGKPLVHVTYSVDAGGLPDAQSQRVISGWFEVGAVPTGIEAARRGRWMRALLDAPAASPGEIVPSAGAPGVVPVRVRIYDVPTPDFVPTTNGIPLLESTLEALR